jgi:hypothetical protein
MTYTSGFVELPDRTGEAQYGVRRLDIRLKNCGLDVDFRKPWTVTLECRFDFVADHNILKALATVSVSVRAPESNG